MSVSEHQRSASQKGGHLEWNPTIAVEALAIAILSGIGLSTFKRDPAPFCKQFGLKGNDADLVRSVIRRVDEMKKARKSTKAGVASATALHAGDPARGEAHRIESSTASENTKRGGDTMQGMSGAPQASAERLSGGPAATMGTVATMGTMGLTSAATLGTSGSYTGTVGTAGSAGSGGPVSAATFGTAGSYTGCVGTAGSAGSGGPVSAATLGTAGSYTGSVGTSGSWGPR